MVFKFRLISDEVKDFIRDVELLSDQTFYDFHRTLTHDFHFDKSQIASFFTSNENWEKDVEITLFDMSEDGKKDVHIMDRVKLEEFLDSPKQRLLYVFDFFNERLLFIELVEVIQKQEKTAYPRITFSRGNPPHQLLMGNNNFEDLDFEE